MQTANRISQDQLASNFQADIDRHNKKTFTPNIDNQQVYQSLQKEMSKMDKTYKDEQKRMKIEKDVNALYDQKIFVKIPIRLLPHIKNAAVQERTPSGRMRKNMLEADADKTVKLMRSDEGKEFVDGINARIAASNETEETCRKLRPVGSEIYMSRNMEREVAYNRLMEERAQQSAESANRWLKEKQLDSVPSGEQVAMGYSNVSFDGNA